MWSRHGAEHWFASRHVWPSAKALAWGWRRRLQRCKEDAGDRLPAWRSGSGSAVLLDGRQAGRRTDVLWRACLLVQVCATWACIHLICRIYNLDRLASIDAMAALGFIARPGGARRAQGRRPAAVVRDASLGAQAHTLLEALCSVCPTRTALVCLNDGMMCGCCEVSSLPAGTVHLPSPETFPGIQIQIVEGSAVGRGW